MKYLKLKELLVSELQLLAQAIEDLHKDMCPHVPLPNPRSFVLFAKGNVVFAWPNINGSQCYWMRAVMNVGGSTYRTFWLGSGFDVSDLSACIIDHAKGSPRRVMAAVRNIRAAATWCIKRLEGRKRHREEILRQQNRWVQELEAELAVQALHGGGE